MMRLLRDVASGGQFCAPTPGRDRMNDDRHKQDSRSWLGLVMRDVQFWVPVAVLIGGLVVLRWIS